MPAARLLIVLAAAAAASASASGTAAADRGLAQAPATPPSTVTIAPASEPGERLRLELVLRGKDDAPVARAVVYAYHTDAKGSYGDGGSRDPRLFGYARSDAAGRVTLDSIRPGPYPQGGTPAHIHVHVGVPGGGEIVGECWFAGDRFLDAALVERERPRGERSRIVRLAREGKGWRGRWVVDVAR